MQKKIKIYQIDAFTDKPFGGNSAGVTFSNDLSEKEKQLIAKEMNVAETAFLSNSEKADYKLQWFTPTTEIELCGHGTIASIHFLYEENKLKSKQDLTFHTLSGILKCKIEDNKYFMQIPIFEMEEFDECKQELISILDIHPTMLDDKVPFIQLSSKNVYIYIKELKDLHKIKPDFKALKELSLKNNLGGIVVFTLETIDKSSFAHSRYFTPSHGIDEDPVTGSTNGPLLLVLEKLGFIKNPGKEISLIFEQGDVMGRRGRIGVSYYRDINELYISGNAVTVLKGEMIF
ncbi:MAG TPA: PhzF family phenazine biosynthesis protein [Ignavibacteriaceae bacterium]|nr:PhzF family phenazine biosynthesis protein [Ignavibacteriaceae bacterium]